MVRGLYLVGLPSKSREISLCMNRPIHRNESERQKRRFIPFEMTGGVRASYADYAVRSRSGSRVVPGYIAVYRIKDEVIEIVRIYHAAQDWP